MILELFLNLVLFTVQEATSGRFGNRLLAKPIVHYFLRWILHSHLSGNSNNSFFVYDVFAHLSTLTLAPTCTVCKECPVQTPWSRCRALLIVGAYRLCTREYSVPENTLRFFLRHAMDTHLDRGGMLFKKYWCCPNLSTRLDRRNTKLLNMGSVLLIPPLLNDSGARDKTKG